MKRKFYFQGEIVEGWLLSKHSKNFVKIYIPKPTQYGMQGVITTGVEALDLSRRNKPPTKPDRKEQIYQKIEELTDKHIEHLLNKIYQNITMNEMEQLKDTLNLDINISIVEGEKPSQIRLNYEKEWM